MLSCPNYRCDNRMCACPKSMPGVIFSLRSGQTSTGVAVCATTDSLLGRHHESPPNPVDLRHAMIGAGTASRMLQWATFGTKEDQSDQTQYQRQAIRHRRARGYALAVGAARRSGSYRNQVWLRYGVVWRLNSTYRWPAGARLHTPDFIARQLKGRHHRSDRRGQGRQGGAGGVDRPGCSAMRILPVWPDHVGDRAPQAQAQAH